MHRDIQYLVQIDEYDENIVCMYGCFIETGSSLYAICYRGMGNYIYRHYSHYDLGIVAANTIKTTYPSK